MSRSAVSALLQVAVRRRLILKERALELAQLWSTCGTDVEALRARMQAGSEVEAVLLGELLPAAGMPAAGGYHHLARLGEGRTASTWLGLSPATDGGEADWVVIKHFHHKLLPPGTAVERFCADVQPLLNADARYLVPYRAVFAAADGSACLVQRYIVGSDLAQRAEVKGATPEARALVLLRQAGKGLRLVQHLGGCHGMLHPSNVLIDADRRALLTDYGLAWSPSMKAVRPGWDAGGLLLHAWAAPETLDEHPTVGIAADVYALACLGYWLLSGKTPFQGPAEQQALEHRGGPRPDVRSLVPTVSGITAKTLLKAMQADPAKRYPGPRELVAAIERNLILLTDAAARGDSGVQGALPTGKRAELKLQE